MPDPPPRSSLTSRYRATLAGISARTGTSLPALVTSFAVLHEATAVVPLVGVFYSCRTFGVGERVVDYARNLGDDNIIRETTQRWLNEGEQWTERVGKKYNLWGYSSSSPSSMAIAGDVANALVAYCATKALLPVRIGFSLYFSPTFARRITSKIMRK